MSDQNTVLSLDDLELLSDSDLGQPELNPNADFNDAPPPPDEGRYIAKPKIVAEKDGSVVRMVGKEGNKAPMYTIDWTITVVRNGQEFSLTKRFWHSAFRGSNGASVHDTIYKAYFKQAPVGLAVGQVAAAIGKKFLSEEQLQIDLQWLATVNTGPKEDDPDGKDQYKNVLRGQKNFPVVGGKHVPLKESDKYPGKEVRTDWDIKMFYPL